MQEARIESCDLDAVLLLPGPPLLSPAAALQRRLFTEAPQVFTDLPNQQQFYQVDNAVPNTETVHYCTLAQSFESGTVAQLC